MPRSQDFHPENATFTFSKLIEIERNEKLISKTSADGKKEKGNNALVSARDAKVARFSF